MLFFDILSELLNKKDNKIEERRAIAEILIYAALSDRRYDISEASKLEELARRLEWPEGERFEDFYKSAVARIREVLISPEDIKPFLEKRVAKISTPESKKLVLSGCKQICRADRKIELEEDALVTQLEKLLR